MQEHRGDPGYVIRIVEGSLVRHYGLHSLVGLVVSCKDQEITGRVKVFWQGSNKIRNVEWKLLELLVM